MKECKNGKDSKQEEVGQLPKAVKEWNMEEIEKINETWILLVF